MRKDAVSAARWSGVLGSVVLACCFAGCKGESSDFKTAEQLKKEGVTPPPDEHAAHGHDHGHAHGEHDHAHDHHAPHGGSLVMLGDHAGFVELLLDSESGILELYVLDGEAEKAVPISQPEVTVEIEPKAAGAEHFAITLSGVIEPENEAAKTHTKYLGTYPQLKGLKEFSAVIEEIELGQDKHFHDLKTTYKPGAVEDHHDDHAAEGSQAPAKDSAPEATPKEEGPKDETSKEATEKPAAPSEAGTTEK